MWYSTTELLALLIVTGGILVQAWIGIGFGLLAAPLLFLLNPAYVPGPVLVLGWGLSLLVVLKQRHRLNWRRVWPAILARLPGSWCGALLLVTLSVWQLSLLFGGALLLAVWLSGQRYRLSPTPVGLTVAGFCSGLLGTATSVGGPPMALLYQYQHRLTTRDELAFFFLMGTPLSILMLIAEGGSEQLALPLVARLLPGVVLGFWLSRWLERRGHSNNARPAILAMSVLSALAVLWQGMQAGLSG